MVYPACAGIDLKTIDKTQLLARLPRMRGDRPPVVWNNLFIVGFTPHARGSTFEPDKIDFPKEVYPACAGIDRTHSG